jgi:hypothetical protein
MKVKLFKVIFALALCALLAQAGEADLVGPAEVYAPGGARRHQVYPSYPFDHGAVLDFDANKVTDARVIGTLPISPIEKDRLELQHKVARNLYENRRYLDAFVAFREQSLAYRGNFLSPYWAGMCALKLGNGPIATAWFNWVLSINPYYLPARNAKLNVDAHLKDLHDARAKERTAKKPQPKKPRGRK